MPCSKYFRLLPSLYKCMVLVALIAPLQLVAAEAELSPDDHIFFEKKVRPILVEHCYSCHSTEAKKVKGNLLLDTKAGWQLGGDIGPAIIPGDPEKSPLIQAVRYDDPDLEMPPKGSIPNAQIETLIEWVERGAPDPRTDASAGAAALAEARRGIDYDGFRQHFPYTQPEAQSVPEPSNPSNQGWAQNEIDRFLLARLESESLMPNPDAEPATVLRRLRFDITGLPPTPAELRAFEKDAAERGLPAAIASTVDELLATPQFGERWGRHWLDMARYADSSGGGRSKVFHEAWRYRDWVIAAHNMDKPYDQFVREQIAGDLLGKDDEAEEASDAIVGTGFLLLAPTNFENQDKKALELDVVDEQIDVIGRAFMGMTIGCARCHDHKFDAISHDDYHAMAGIFLSTKSLKHSNVSDPWKRELTADPELKTRWTRYEKQLESMNKDLRELRIQVATVTREMNPNADAAAGPSRELDGIVIDNSAAEKVGFWKPSSFVKGYIGANYIHDESKGKGEKRVIYTPELPAAGRYEVRVSHTPSGNRDTAVPFEVQHTSGKTVVKVNQRRAGPIDRVWTSLGSFNFAAGKTASVVLQTDGTKDVVIADAVQFIPEEPVVEAEPTNPPAKQTSAEIAAAEQKKQAAEALRLEQAEKLKALEQKLASAEAAKKAFEKTDKPPTLPVAMAVAEHDKPEDMQERVRGVANKLGDRVPRGFLTVAAKPLATVEGSGRRQLAEWLTDNDNPFVARVAVNRLWKHVFGEGIVRSPDNFGAMGEQPSHPDLLDWLALQFIDDGWSVKTALRRMFNSRAYRMSSEMHTGHYYADAENRLLWRAHQKRLEAEALRDTMLMVSGQLDLAGGGSVFHAGLNNVQSFKHGGNTRRSVYQPVFRNNLPQIFEVFDFADSNQPIGRRTRSVLPVQALYLMNSPDVMEIAETAAAHLTKTAESEPRDWFVIILGREPSPAEEQAARRFLGDKASSEQAALLIQTLFASHDFRTLK